MSLTTTTKIVTLSSLLLLLLLLVEGGEVSLSANASSISELTPTPPSSPFNTTSIVNTSRPFNNTSTFGQVPLEPLPQQLLPQQPLPQQPEAKAQVTAQDRIQETLNTVLTTNTSSTNKTLLLAELERSIENMTSNQYDVTVDFTEGENGGESYLISIERIIVDPVIAEEEEEEEEGNGDGDNGDNNGNDDNGSEPEEDLEDEGNGGDDDEGNGVEDGDMA